MESENKIRKEIKVNINEESIHYINYLATKEKLSQENIINIAIQMLIDATKLDKDYRLLYKCDNTRKIFGGKIKIVKL